MWLEVATIIHNTTNGQKSIDDFCHLFHGGANNGPEVKTYTFDQLVAALNQIAPYDWASFLHQRLDSISPDAPTGGIENGGWKVTWSPEPIRLPGRRGASGDAYSIGLQLGEDGSVSDSIVGGPAFKAGISAGMKVIGVNGRIYTHDLLEDAIAAAKDSPRAHHADLCHRRLHPHRDHRLSRRRALSPPHARRLQARLPSTI